MLAVKTERYIDEYLRSGAQGPECDLTSNRNMH